MAVILYLVVIFLEFVFVFGFCVYMFFLIYSHLKGSPYVPTKMKEVRAILAELNPKKKSVFYDLGCGDGRVVREAVYAYKVKGTGIDINPVLILWAKVISRLQKVHTIFLKKNIYDMSFKDADYIYAFLMPEFLKKLVPKFKKEMKKGSILVSHGFVIEEFKPYLKKKLDHKPFPTYFYRLK